MTKDRMLDLDIGRGLLMVMLVFRHSISQQFPQGNEWYVFLYHVLGWFQMPVFLFISGIIMGYTYRRPKDLADYAQYIKKRFLRLVPAYVLFASIIFAGKLLIQQFVIVENPIQGFSDYLTIFVSPKHSNFASYLWFVYVLFLYYLLISLYLLAAPGKIVWLVIPAVILNLMTLPGFLAIDLMGEYLIYFVLGFIAAEHYPEYLKIVDRFRYLWWTLFLTLCTFAVFVQTPVIFIALPAIPAFQAFCRIPLVTSSTILKMVGDYMYPVYLINTIPINLARILILKFMSWDGTAFLIVLPILMTVGIAAPILTQKYVISKTPVLKRIIY